MAERTTDQPASALVQKYLELLRRLGLSASLLDDCRSTGDWLSALPHLLARLKLGLRR